MTKEEAFKLAMQACKETWNEKTCKQIKEALKQTTWISVSERLPEECTAVLIWCPERKNIYCAYLEEKQWWIFGAHFQKVLLEVIAWMPLPLSYKGE